MKVVRVRVMDEDEEDYFHLEDAAVGGMWVGEHGFYLKLSEEEVGPDPEITLYPWHAVKWVAFKEEK